MRTQRPRGRHRSKVCSELDAELGLKSRLVCKASGGVFTAVQSEDTQLNLNFKEIMDKALVSVCPKYCKYGLFGSKT